MKPADRPSPVDAELFERLERAFAHHAKGGESVTVDALKEALGLKSEFLARRVLAAFDRDGNGKVSRAEFVEGARALVYGTPEEKLAFAFRVHDLDGDGTLDREELTRMIALSVAESGVTGRETQTPAHLVGRLLMAADTNRDGRITFQELLAVVRGRTKLFDQMTRSEAIWLSPNEDLLLALDGPATRRPGRLAQLIANRGPTLAFFALWVLANVGVIAWSMTLGRTHATADHAMELGRALGAALDLNAALIFVPVMRRFLGKARGTWLGRVLPLDDAIDFHKLLGHTLFAGAVVHTAAFVWAYAAGHPSAGALAAFTTQRGLTGAIWLGLFAIMWTFSLSAIRRSRRFELFYFTHLLYAPWLVVALLHAPRLVVFAGGAFLGFLVEGLLRLRRRGKASPIASMYPLRSGVTRVELERPKGFDFQAGDFVFLRIPAIARHEWHPYTISSAPEVGHVTVHVRSLGNWSQAVRALAERKPAKGELVAYVDSPYGSPSAHIFQGRFAVLIGAGIGVTPFASVLESIVMRTNEVGAPTSLEKVHFFWLNRDAYSFEWFRGMLSRLEGADRRGLVDMHLCMTDGRAGVTAFGLELARELMAASGRSDFMTGLRTHTHLGPPDWERMLGAIAKKHAPETVEVFFCGPHGLGRTLEPICHRLGMRFREERF